MIEKKEEFSMRRVPPFLLSSKGLIFKKTLQNAMTEKYLTRVRKDRYASQPKNREGKALI